MTDYKQLCAELIDALDSGITAGAIRMSPLAHRARAALAEPEPEGPTDQELAEFLQQLTYKEMSEGSPFGAPSWDPDKERQRELSRARAVLDRWCQ